MYSGWEIHRVPTFCGCPMHSMEALPSLDSTVREGFVFVLLFKLYIYNGREDMSVDRCACGGHRTASCVNPLPSTLFKTGSLTVCWHTSIGDVPVPPSYLQQ